MDYSKLSDATLDKLSKNEPIDYSALNDDELSELTKYQGPSTPAPAQAAPVTEAPGYGESAARGAAQGLTFGFADEIQAGTESLLDGANYDKRVREIRDEYKAAADENPITYHGADILSGFALPLGAVGGFATKGASTLGKIARSAGSGAILGGAAGAGTSEAADASGVAKDALTGAGVGAVAGPVIEGAITGASNYLGKKATDIGAIKDITDFFKYGKKGVELTGADNLRLRTAEGKKAVEGELIPELDEAVKLKNAIYEQGKEASEAAGKTVNIKQFEDMINKAEAAGADPQQINKLRRELGIIGKQQEVPVTDPAEYQKLYREKLTEESQKLKENAYQVQMRNAEKAGQRAYKEAEKLNKEMIKTHKAELKIKYPTIEDKQLMELAEKELAQAKTLKDPSVAAKEARDRVAADAEALFSGTKIDIEPTTGETIASATVAPNKRIIESAQTDDAGKIINNLSPRAGVEIEKLADKNAAYAYALAERENKKAMEKLAGVYRDKQMSASQQNIIDELKKTGDWVDPVSAAKQAKDGTKLSDQPIDIERYFSPEIGKDVLSAKTGEQELLTKILPQFKFTKQQYQKPELGVRDVEAFRNFLSDMTSRDKQLDFRSLEQLQGAHRDVRRTYNDLLGEETANAALETDKKVRTSLAEMGVDSLINDSGIENKINLRDQLAKLMYKANTAKGANESVKIEEAFKGLKDIYKNNPEKLKEVTNAFENVKDKMRQAYLSDITTGHNTFAIDPTSINWTMTAGGKIGMVANEAGLLVNKIANAPVGQILAQSKRFADKGYKKYSAVFDRMSSLDDLNKRRALLYTLLQDPGFRQAMSEDIVGDDNAGK